MNFFQSDLKMVPISVLRQFNFTYRKLKDCIKNAFWNRENLTNMTPAHKNNMKLLTKKITDQWVHCLYHRKYLKKKLSINENLSEYMENFKKVVI